MRNLNSMNQKELLKVYDSYIEEYNDFKKLNLKLDMSRGKPSSKQLDISLPLLDAVNSKSSFVSESGIDCRNYSTLEGISEMKRLISGLTDIPEENFIIGGNSSLSMMFDAISCFMIHGVNGKTPWAKQNKIKFLCPSPGYDRHFGMSEYFGMELITVPMTSEGPDMDFVEKILSEDSCIKGMWCVPKYSNPQGITYSDNVVKRIAALKPAANDFRLFWDNAYFVHDLTDNPPFLLNIFDECKKHNNEELPLIFFSTSKITFPGSGVSFLACGKENLKQLKKNYSFKMVCFDKMNQLRHIRFLKDKNTLKNHMKKHSQIIKSKFDIVLSKLESEFSNSNILTWNNPKGGYFISVDTIPGCAKEVVKRCKEIGLVLTNAGATFPYGKDLRDSNIRLAPTYPSESELKLAIDIFCLVVKIVYIERKLLNKF